MTPTAPAAELRDALVAALGLDKPNNDPPVTKPRINRKPILYLSVNIINLPEIDTVAQSFSCELVIRGWTSGLAGASVWTHPTEPAPRLLPTRKDQQDPRWSDERFARPLREGEWDPRLRITNLVECASWKMSAKWSSETAGEMEFKWSLTGRFLEQMEIAEFPRDVQRLTIKLTSATPQFVINGAIDSGSHKLGGTPVALDAIPPLLDELSELQHAALQLENSSLLARTLGGLSVAERRRLAQLEAWRSGDDRVQRVLRLAPHREADGDELRRDVVQHANFGMSNAWVLSDCVRCTSLHSRSSASGTGAVRPCLNVTLLVSRRPQYYLWNIELPMGVLTSLTAVTWSVPLADVADRLGLSLTLVLTAVAYKLTVASCIPQVSYLTNLDAFVSICFCFMVFAAVENAAVGVIAAKADGAEGVAGMGGEDGAHLGLVQLDHALGGVWTIGWATTVAWYVIKAVLITRRRHWLESAFADAVRGKPKAKPKALPKAGGARTAEGYARLEA